METTTILTIFGLATAVGTLVTTILIAVVNSLRQDIKGQSTKHSETAGKLWEQVNTTTNELSSFKEHVALNYPNDKRLNEKMEANRQHMDSALAGITHRLSKLEGDSGQILKHVNEQATGMREVLSAFSAMRQWMENHNVQKDK